MKKGISLFALFLTLTCLHIAFTSSAQTGKFVSQVNPFIGTGGHGHTFPGASMPFGMMQLSPDTRLEGWDGCSGYHYSDSIMYGFSHTHLSGTGVGDYCDVLLMPFTGAVKWKNSEYASPFSHKNEKASPGYYQVKLDKHQIDAELTTTIRAGMHQYTYPEKTEPSVLIDLKHRDEVLESSIEIVNEYEIRGSRISKGWANRQILYFYIRTEKPIQSYGIAIDDQLKSGIKKAEGKNIKSFIKFATNANNIVRLKIAISGVSMENARMNLDAEIKDWDFNRVRINASSAWEKELGKIEVRGGTADQRTSFYTALYHACLAPNVYADVNGDYRGTDLKVHNSKTFTNYTVFSLWDTHRALNPLMTLINRKRTNDFINTFLVQYQQGGMLPVWELSGNETFCMIGYHSVPVIVDAYQKGIRNFDTKLALEAMTNYAESNRFGLEAYQKRGFLSNFDDHESASKTVEYAYDDWCIAAFAKSIGDIKRYNQYTKRSLNYRNLYDPNSGHIRGKLSGIWYSPFDATEINNFFTEGNSWHYSFNAMHDIDGMIQLHGGKENFNKKLEELFTTSAGMSGRDQQDVTGLIGQYAHGNEPSHHMSYLFNYAGTPWRTQEIVHKICTEFYPNNPDGLIGNEDCGQMSAWFVWSAMGFYPVTPGSGKYAMGTPLFDEVIINQENGKTFRIKANRSSEKAFYVTGAKLNGKNYPNTFINHSDIFNGGQLVFELGTATNKARGVQSGFPSTGVQNEDFVAVPYMDMATNKFKESLEINLKHIEKSAEIWYTFSAASNTFKKYTGPLNITESATITFYASRGNKKSGVVAQQLYKLPTDKTIKVLSNVHPMYTAGGPEALIDGIKGTVNWKTGEWQSYFAQDFEAIIDLLQIRDVNYVGIDVLQDISPWIRYPSYAQFEISNDGVNFVPLGRVDNKIDASQKDVVQQELGTKVNGKGRYVRVFIKNGGPLPAWHESAGQATHLFIDEIIVR